MIYPVPFEYVRAGLNKDYLTNPVIHKYVVFNNWDRQNIKSTQLDKTAVTYPAFNPDNFADEVEFFGGIENHPRTAFVHKLLHYEALSAFSVSCSPV